VRWRRFEIVFLGNGEEPGVWDCFSWEGTLLFLLLPGRPLLGIRGQCLREWQLWASRRGRSHMRCLVILGRLWAGALARDCLGL
jgi:hypothetical protein